MKPPIITLTTDFGTSDHYVAAMKGVILGICPQATLVDISHNVAAYSVAEGAFLVAQAWQSFPRGTIHLVVVDPGVGSERRPLVVEADGHYFVAPDNGVLTLVLDACRSSRIREITGARFFRQPLSQTFHGRDIFAPVAARLAGGLAVRRVGSLISDEGVRLPFGRPRQTGPKRWAGAVLHIDRFGNVVTNFSTEGWPNLFQIPFRLHCRRKVISQAATSYADMKPGRICLIAGSAGFWEMSCNQQDTGKILGVKRGTKLGLLLL